MRSAAVAFLVMMAGAALFDAQTASAASQSSSRSPTADALALSDPPHARTRIRVTPLPQYWQYHRQCTFRLVREVRASGTYVVPREHCRWVPFAPP